VEETFEEGQVSCRTVKPRMLMYLRATSFSHQLELLVKFRVKEVYLFYIFFTANITIKISMGLC
jgi:hypothetical protein